MKKALLILLSLLLLFNSFALLISANEPIDNEEDIFLDLPAKFLCKEDCKGICFTCGKNLNEGQCSCS